MAVSKRGSGNARARANSTGNQPPGHEGAPLQRSPEPASTESSLASEPGKRKGGEAAYRWSGLVVVAVVIVVPRRALALGRLRGVSATARAPCMHGRGQPTNTPAGELKGTAAWREGACPAHGGTGLSGRSVVMVVVVVCVGGGGGTNHIWLPRQCLPLWPADGLEQGSATRARAATADMGEEGGSDEHDSTTASARATWYAMPCKQLPAGGYHRAPGTTHPHPPQTTSAPVPQEGCTAARSTLRTPGTITPPISQRASPPTRAAPHAHTHTHTHTHTRAQPLSQPTARWRAQSCQPNREGRNAPGTSTQPQRSGRC